MVLFVLEEGIEDIKRIR